MLPNDQQPHAAADAPTARETSQSREQNRSHRRRFPVHERVSEFFVRRSQPSRKLLSPGLLLAGTFCAVSVAFAVAAMLEYLDVARGQEGSLVVAQARGRFGPLDRLFDLSDLSVPRDELRSGGPGKDGIPALTEPNYVPAGQATFLNGDDRVIGLEIDGAARAYPLRILNYHEAVNDRIGEVPFAVTYCPLCDSAVVFDRRLDGRTVELGISGWLYNSNVLLYDRPPEGAEALYSQMAGGPISGPDAGDSLRTIPFELTTWRDWRRRHPDTLVLSPRTGHRRDYSRSPYSAYFRRPDLMFPVNPQPPSGPLALKDRVLGVWTGSEARAYPLQEFREAGEVRILEQALAGKRFRLGYDPEADALRVLDAEEGLNWAYSFWFAWYAFHPDTEVYQAPARE